MCYSDMSVKSGIKYENNYYIKFLLNEKSKASFK